LRIVVAPDSFKESMTACEVTEAIYSGIKAVSPNWEVIKVPLADGGEETASLISKYKKATCKKAVVTGPLGERREIKYGMTKDRTVIFDVAEIIGLQHIPKNFRNPLMTTSYGVGELIRYHLDRGNTNFIIGLGGSATNDGGLGMLQALGLQALDNEGKEVIRGGKGLLQLAQLKTNFLDKRLGISTFTIVHDVKNRLLGRDGATFTFAKQKGADLEMCKQLEQGMVKYANLVEHISNRRIKEVDGLGAAGGLATAFYAFTEANFRLGIDYMLEVSRLEEKLANCHLVITGEGKIDEQTLHGKTIYGVAQKATLHSVPVIALVGANELPAEKLDEVGLRAVFPIVTKPMPLEEAIKKGERLIETTTKQITRLLLTNELFIK